MRVFFLWFIIYICPWESILLVQEWNIPQPVSWATVQQLHIHFTTSLPAPVLFSSPISFFFFSMDIHSFPLWFSSDDPPPPNAAHMIFELFTCLYFYCVQSAVELCFIDKCTVLLHWCTDPMFKSSTCWKQMVNNDICVVQVCDLLKIFFQLSWPLPES